MFLVYNENRQTNSSSISGESLYFVIKNLNSTVCRLSSLSIHIIFIQFFFYTFNYTFQSFWLFESKCILTKKKILGGVVMYNGKKKQLNTKYIMTTVWFVLFSKDLNRIKIEFKIRWPNIYVGVRAFLK